MILYNHYVPGLIGLQLTTKWDHTFFCTPKLLHQSLGCHPQSSSKWPSASPDNAPGCCLLPVHSGEGASPPFSPFCYLYHSTSTAHSLSDIDKPMTWPVLCHLLLLLPALSERTLVLLSYPTAKTGKGLCEFPQNINRQSGSKAKWFNFRTVRKNTILTKAQQYLKAEKSKLRYL